VEAGGRGSDQEYGGAGGLTGELELPRVDVDEVLAHRGGSFRAPLDGSEFAGASIDPRSQPNSNGSKWWRRGNWDGRPLPTCSSLSLAVLTEGKSLGEVSQGWVGPAFIGAGSSLVFLQIRPKKSSAFADSRLRAGKGTAAEDFHMAAERTPSSHRLFIRER
jgi:hypothetical protein